MKKIILAIALFAFPAFGMQPTKTDWSKITDSNSIGYIFLKKAANNGDKDAQYQLNKLKAEKIAKNADTKSDLYKLYKE